MNTKADHSNQYLWCGYLLPDEFLAWLSEYITPEYAGQSYSPHVAAGRFDTLFNNLVDQSQEGRYIIPLSGGWDSRVILGALLERVDNDRIVSFTFGVPCQLDYDLGKMLAESMGVKHHAIDLRSIAFTCETIRESVRESPWTYVPDGFFNSLIRIMFSQSSDTIWSGFLGCELDGSHLLNSVNNFHDPVSDFSFKQHRGKTHSLCLPGFFLIGPSTSG